MRFRKARKEESSQLKEMCKGSDIVREAPAQPVKSPALVARLEKLQKLDDERRYQEMVHDITGHVSNPCHFVHLQKLCFVFDQETLVSQDSSTYWSTDWISEHPTTLKMRKTIEGFFS